MNKLADNEVCICVFCESRRGDLERVGTAQSVGTCVISGTCIDCGEHVSVHTYRKGRIVTRELLDAHPRRETPVVNRAPWLEGCGPECPREGHIHKLLDDK